MSFLSIYYDHYKNKIYHRHINPETNRPKTEIISPKYEYYIQDRTNTSEMKDIFGNSVIKKEAKNRDGLKSIIQSGITTYETDIPTDIKFLNEEYGKESLQVDMDKFNICNFDIETSTNGTFSSPEKADCPINAITIRNSKGTIYTFGIYEYTGDSDLVKNYLYCADEKLMLEKFMMFFRKQKFDILTGWYINGFDIPYIINRMEKLGIDYTKLSPYGIVNKKRGTEEYIIAGISILDYLDLYKRFNFTDRESYSLDYIGKYEGVGGKLEFEGTISEIWKTDWNKWIEYNVQDVLIVDALDKKLRFIEQAIAISYDSLIPFEQVFATLPMHIGYCLKFLHNKNMVMPVKGDVERKSYPGGHVFRKLGMHDYVVSFDVTSLYPTLIRQFNIGPETLVKDPENTDGLIKTPTSVYKDWVTSSKTWKGIGGIYYKKDTKSILVEIVESIFFGRIRDKKKKTICDMISKGTTDDEICNKLSMMNVDLSNIKDEINDEQGNSAFYQSRQMIRKIQINSLYGALGTPYFNFYNIDNAIAVTLSGQTTIKYLSENVNKYLKMKYKLKEDIVVLIDTDSNYISFAEIIKNLGLEFKTNDDFLVWAYEFIDEVVEPFFVKILKIFAEKYNTEPLIDFNREKISRNMLVLDGKKKYALNVLDNEGTKYDEPQVKVTGIEVVRTSTPIFCRNRLKSSLELIFETQDKDELTEFIRKAKIDFNKQDVEDIAFPRGVSDYKKYAKSYKYYEANGLSYPNGCPIANRASINYNYLVDKYDLKLQKVDNGSKVKFIYIKPDNMLNQNVIAFIGNYPNKFKELFDIDYKVQFSKSFQDVIQRFFDAMKWGEINFSAKKLSQFFN